MPIWWDHHLTAVANFEIVPHFEAANRSTSDLRNRDTEIVKDERIGRASHETSKRSSLYRNVRSLELAQWTQCSELFGGQMVEQVKALGYIQ